MCSTAPRNSARRSGLANDYLGDARERTLHIGAAEVAMAAMAMTTELRERIAVWADPEVRRHALGLDAFVRFCVFRAERSVGCRHAWQIHVGPGRHGFVSHVVVRVGEQDLEEQGTSFDAALATWNAIDRLEERLREHHAASHGLDL